MEPTRSYPLNCLLAVATVRPGLGARMWVKMADDGTVARDADGKPIPLPVETPRSVMVPEATPRTRRTGTGVRDASVVHFTGRRGTKNDGIPDHIRDASASKRLWMILRDRALLAVPTFGRRYTYPTVCFCEGDAAARALLLRNRNYSGHAVAFKRSAVERWGARPVVYADADIIERLMEALNRLERYERDDPLEGDQLRMNLIRALLIRDWPGSREDHPLADVDDPNEWSHEHEMRLILPTHDHGNAYWTFDEEDIAHLLLPEDLVAATKLARTAIKRGHGWILDLPVRLIGDDGEPADDRPLRELV